MSICVCSHKFENITLFRSSNDLHRCFYVGISTIAFFTYSCARTVPNDNDNGNDIDDDDNDNDNDNDNYNDNDDNYDNDNNVRDNDNDDNDDDDTHQQQWQIWLQGCCKDLYQSASPLSLLHLKVFHYHNTMEW